MVVVATGIAATTAQLYCVQRNSTVGVGIAIELPLCYIYVVQQQHCKSVAADNSDDQDKTADAATTKKKFSHIQYAA